jgi:hypothetical protein
MNSPHSIFTLPEQQLTPPEFPVRYTPNELKYETQDMLDRLLANPKRIENLVMDGGPKDFNFSDTRHFFDLVSRLLTCKADDRVDVIDDIRNLCERSLKDEAEEMAIQYLEAREV